MIKFNAKNAAVAAALAGAMALGATGAIQAAPAFANNTTVKSAMPSDVTDVRWRRSSRNAAVAGFAAGTVLGLGVAAATRPNYYYYDQPAYGYGYDSPAYGYGYDSYAYEPAPTYYYGRSRGGYSSQRTVTY